jgi:hypothetical protein
MIGAECVRVSLRRSPIPCQVPDGWNLERPTDEKIRSKRSLECGRPRLAGRSRLVELDTERICDPSGESRNRAWTDLFRSCPYRSAHFDFGSRDWAGGDHPHLWIISTSRPRNVDPPPEASEASDRGPTPRPANPRFRRPTKALWATPGPRQPTEARFYGWNFRASYGRTDSSEKKFGMWSPTLGRSVAPRGA